MDIRTEEFPRNITKVLLAGRLDSSGAVEIELPFNTLATEKRALMVDLTAVTLLSSYGMRLLLVGARICADKGGKLVIVCPENHVAKVLRISRFDALAPVFASEDEALAAFS